MDVIAPARRRGPLPTPRLRLRCEFIDAVRESSLTMAIIALQCGFKHGQRFSHLIYEESVPITSRALFESVARLIDYPASQIFIDTPDASTRLVRQGADEACV